MTHRLALIHALVHSPGPINAVLAREWPQAERMNLLDDSLSADLARLGTLDTRMTQRFIALADYAVETGAHAILFTCSAFGPCIDAVKRRHAGIPVLKPNEAMIDEAVQNERLAYVTPRNSMSMRPPTAEALQTPCIFRRILLAEIDTPPVMLTPANASTSVRL